MTWNNCTAEEEAALIVEVETPRNGIHYICWGHEHYGQGQGTPHLQMFVMFTNQ